MTFCEAFQIAMNFVQDVFKKHPDEFIELEKIWGDIQRLLIDKGYEQDFFQIKDFCGYLYKQAPDMKSRQSRVNAIYRLQVSVPKFFHEHFVNSGSAVFNSNGCIVQYMNGMMVLGEPNDAVISKFLISNLSKIERMKTKEEMILEFIETRKNSGPKDKQYLDERFDEVFLKVRTNKRISEFNRGRILQVMRFFAGNEEEEARTSSGSLAEDCVNIPPKFCYPSLQSHRHKYELSDYLCFLESVSLQTISPISHAEIAAAYEESRKNAEFKVENILEKIPSFNDAIQDVHEFSKVSKIRLLFITQTPCISFRDLGYKVTELFLDNTKKVVEFKPRNIDIHLQREIFSINRTREQISLNPMPWSTREVDALFHFIFVESANPDAHMSLTQLCQKFKRFTNTRRKVEQLYSKAYEYLSTEYYDMGPGINFTKKLSILYGLRISLNLNFIEQCLKTRAIFQLNKRKELVFASCSGTCIGKLDEKESTSLSSIQLNLLEIIRCLSLKTMKIISNQKIIQVYSAANPGSLIQIIELHEKVNMVKNLFESYYECSIFSRLHMLYVTQTDVSDDFRRKLARFDVNYILNRITGYTANNICVNFDRVNSSWIEEVETTDTAKERQGNSMLESFYFTGNNIKREIMESLKILGKLSLGTFMNQQIFEVLQNKTRGNYTRREFNDALEEFKSNIKHSDVLGPFIQLRLLFMTRTPVSEPFLQKWGEKYDIQVDNQKVILRFKAVVCLSLNRNDGIRMEEYKQPAPSASTSVILLEDVPRGQSFDDNVEVAGPLTDDIKEEQPDQSTPETDQNFSRISPEKQNSRPQEANGEVAKPLRNQKTRRDEVRRPKIEEIKIEDSDDYETSTVNYASNSEMPGTSSGRNLVTEKRLFGPTGLDTTKHSSLKRGSSTDNVDNEIEAKKQKSRSSNQESRQTISEEEGINLEEPTIAQTSQSTFPSDAPSNFTAPLPHTSAKNILLILRTSVAVLRMTEFLEFEDRITETIGNIEEDNVPIETLISTLGRTLSMVCYPLKKAKKESDSMLVSKALNVLIYVSFGLKHHFADFPALSAIVAEIEKAEKSLEGSDKRISIEEVKLAFQNWIMVLGDSS